MKGLRTTAFCCICLLTLGISLPAQEIADSFDDWSTTGTQGENNWFYGWYNLTEDEEFDDGEYAADDFNEFENDGSNLVESIADFYYPRDAQSPENHWTGGEWDLNTAAQPWTAIGREATHPNGINYREEHWTVRRWVSDREHGVIPVQDRLNHDIDVSVSKQHLLRFSEVESVERGLDVRKHDAVMRGQQRPISGFPR